MASDHILYLTSTGNLNIFPRNRSTNFVNRLSTPIVLESNTEYEVGLVSILYPDRYYGILGNNEKYSITVFTKQDNVGETSIKVLFQNHILAGDIENMVKIANSCLTNYLKAFFGRNYSYLFNLKKKKEFFNGMKTNKIS